VAMAKAVLNSGPQAVVIDALGRGQVPPDWMPAIRDAIAEGMVVAVCTSTLHGGTHQSYEYSGTLYELENLGAFGVSHLSARKARIRLALSMAAGAKSVSEFRNAFTWQALPA